MVILIVLVLMLSTSGQVAAQTPEPTPTPTPNYLQAVPLSTGNSLLIVKSVTYGDIAIVISVLLLVVVILLVGMLTIPKTWLGKK